MAGWCPARSRGRLTHLVARTHRRPAHSCVRAVGASRAYAAAAAAVGALRNSPGASVQVASDALLSGAPDASARVRAAAGPATLTGPAERPATLEEVYLALLEPVAA